MKTSWFLNQRLSWIAEMLDVYGFIQRQHLERKFSISTPQASLDLRRFDKLYPGYMTYDVSRKAYVKAEIEKTCNRQMWIPL